MTHKHKITPADILRYADYAAARTEWRRRMAEVKARRRIAVGPFVTFHFESWQTMWHQIQEMLHIERGGAAQLVDELAAYNPLVPNGHELVATFMIEIDDEARRKAALAQLGGIEATVFIEVGGEIVRGVPEADQDRTTAEGKASSVQFVHFPFTPAQTKAFRRPGTRVLLGLGHAQYSHMAVLPEAVRAELAGDFD